MSSGTSQLLFVGGGKVKVVFLQLVNTSAGGGTVNLGTVLDSSRVIVACVSFSNVSDTSLSVGGIAMNQRVGGANHHLYTLTNASLSGSVSYALGSSTFATIEFYAIYGAKEIPFATTTTNGATINIPANGALIVGASSNFTTGLTLTGSGVIQDSSVTSPQNNGSGHIEASAALAAAVTANASGTILFVEATFSPL